MLVFGKNLVLVLKNNNNSVIMSKNKTYTVRKVCIRENLEEKVMKTKKIISIVLAIALVLSTAVVPRPAQAVKAVSEKSFYVTLTKEHPKKYLLMKTTSRSWKNCQTDFYVTIMQIKGKPKKKKLEYLFGYESDGSKGSLVYEYSAKKFVKGAVLTASPKFPEGEPMLGGAACVEVELPEGVQSIKYKVTFKNKQNKKMIKGISTIKSWNAWYKYKEKK